MVATDPTSQRLVYRKLSPADLDAFHALVTDGHVRRYLLDGETMPRAWSASVIRASQKMFRERGVGLWLVSPSESAAPPAGFCGFLVFEELGEEPQLSYGFLQSHTAKGYATEAARALVSYARDEARMDEIVSAVDEPNIASMRVLEKVEFRRYGSVPGAFGQIVLFELAAEA